jgi:hypothetical protein
MSPNHPVNVDARSKAVPSGLPGARAGYWECWMA